MPHRAAIIGDLNLVEIDKEAPIPTLLGQIDGRRLTIRFDVAALAKVAGAVVSQGAVTQGMREREPAIKAAAQTLLQGGFWTETDDGIEILITALDL